MKLELSIQSNVSMKSQVVYLILAKIAPASDYHIEDVHNAGGVSAIINEILKKPGAFNGDCITVTGKTLRENVAGCEIVDKNVIRPLDNPHSERGGLAVLFGNLAPDGSIIKVGAVDKAVGGYHSRTGDLLRFSRRSTVWNC